MKIEFKVNGVLVVLEPDNVILPTHETANRAVREYAQTCIIMKMKVYVDAQIPPNQIVLRRGLEILALITIGE